MDADSRHAQTFYDSIRTWTVSLTLLGLFYAGAHGLVRRFRQRVLLQPLQPPHEDEDPRFVSIPHILCTTALALAFASMALLPSTIVGIEVMQPDNYYLQWLTADLIFRLWDRVFWGNVMSFFVLVPFAYFYHEAVGFGSSHGMTARVYEAATVLGLLLALVLSAEYLCMQVLQVDRPDYMLFNYTLLCLVGAGVFFAATPIGFARMISNSFSSLFTPLNYRARAQDRVDAATLEVDSVRRRLLALQHADPACDPAVLQVHRDALAAAEARAADELMTLQRRRPFLFHAVAVLATLTTLFLPVLITLRIAVGQLYRLAGTLGLTSAAGLDADADASRKHHLLFGRAGAEHSNNTGGAEAYLAAVYDDVLILYFLAAALTGLHDLVVMRGFRPKIGATRLPSLILNTAVVLMLGASFPVVVRVHGLTSFNLMGHYNNAAFLQSPWLLFAYNASFLVAASVRWLRLIRSQPLDALFRLVTFRPAVAIWSPTSSPTAAVEAVRSRAVSSPLARQMPPSAVVVTPTFTDNADAVPLLLQRPGTARRRATTYSSLQHRFI